MVARTNSGAQQEDPEGVVVRDEKGFLSLRIVREDPEPEKPKAPASKKK
jgi:hypothetical protein